MYENFIKEEREYGKKFLQMNQIFEDRFDECEYTVAKALFKNESMVSAILENIGDLMKKEGIKCMPMNVILGDFIFSMSSFSIEDPSNLILKTSRNDYFRRIGERAEINKSFGCEYHSYIDLHKKLLLGLRADGIVEKNVIRRKDKEQWESVVYFKLLLEGRIEIPLGYSKFPFVISMSQKYSIGSFRNIWTLKRKKKEMEDFPICIKSVIKSNNLMFNLDKNIYNLCSEIIEGEKIKILNKIKCSSMEEYEKKLYQIIKDVSYSKTIGRGELSEGDRFSLYKLKVEMKKELQDILKSFQDLIPFMTITRNIVGNKYYLPCFIDNRGRQYFGTLLSPTFYKIFRYLYKFVEEKEFVKLEESVFYRKMIEYKNAVSDFGKNDRNSYILMILFIEIGKHFIKTDDRHFVKTEEIINLGILNYKKEKVLKFDELLYVSKIESEIEKLLNNEDFDKNMIVFKDATASGLQNYGILMGYNDEKLKYLNLDGDEWCDTYQYLIDKFISKEEKYRKRKYWKSTIMTIPYNAVWFSCFVKFIEKIREDGVEYKDLPEFEKERIKALHKRFYEEIKNKVKEEFYINKSANFVKFKYNRWKISNRLEYKITYKKLRDKYSDITYDIIEDKEGTLRSMEANNMHYLDAKLVKRIVENFDILPIHDCFGVRLSELHLVVDEINEYYSKIIGKKIYNIHIIK